MPKNQFRNFILWEFKSYFCLMCYAAFSKAFINVGCSLKTSTAGRIVFMDTATIRYACKTPGHQAVKPTVIQHNVPNSYSR